MTVRGPAASLNSVLTDIMVYPVKSARGAAVRSAAVERWGLRGDRRWLLVGPDGQRLRVRRLPAVMDVTARPEPDGGLTLAARGMPDLAVPAPTAGNGTIPVDVYGLDRAVDGGAAAHDWLSRALDRPVRLVWLDDPTRRPVKASHGGLPGDPLSFADTAPLLLVTTASLRQVEAWAGTRLDFRRFRPNVVVDTDTPFAEERWGTVRIGDVGFRLAEHCDRCATTLIDPDTLERGREPIRSLARHRRREGRTWFGIRIIPEAPGEIRVGDPVAAVPA